MKFRKKVTRRWPWRKTLDTQIQEALEKENFVRAEALLDEKEKRCKSLKAELKKEKEKKEEERKRKIKL